MDSLTSETRAVHTMLTTQLADLAKRLERWRAAPPIDVLAELGALRAELHYFDDTLADYVVELRECARRTVAMPGTSRLGVELEGAA